MFAQGHSLYEKLRVISVIISMCGIDDIKAAPLLIAIIVLVMT